MVGSMHSVSSFVGGLSSVVTEYFECDYEKDCTPLYKAIETAIVQEEEDYETIAYFLETGLWPHEEAGDVANNSAEIQAKTWVTRFNPKEKDKVEWSQLPLHLAIVGGCPSNIIGGLVKLYPQGLRCTDDQQMLPLHLALRHGADDEIVAYLLMQFPDAVNARGKNERTAVDCALRARDKLRGIILETFVEKTKIKMENYFLKEKEEVMALFNETNQKLEKVSSEVNAKDSALSELMKTHTIVASELQSLKEAKLKMEETLSAQIKELAEEKAELETSSKIKIEKLTHEKLAESIDLQKRINDLMSDKDSAEEAIKRAKELEISTRGELDTVQRSLATTNSMDEWNTIKQEIDNSQAYRLTKTKSIAREEIESLKSDIDKTLQNSSMHETKELKNDLISIKKTISQLEKTESKAKTTDEVLQLQSEVEKLRANVRSRTDTTKALSELAALKITMENELKKPAGRTPEQLVAIESAIVATNPTELQLKTLGELNIIKNELQKLNLELKETELARKTAANIEEMDRELDSALLTASPTLKSELIGLKPAIENLRKFVASSKSKNDVIGVAKDVESLRDLLHKKQTKSNLQAEASIINENVDSALVSTAGETQKKELLQMKETIRSLSTSAVENKDLEELNQLKAELLTVKKQLKDVEEATKMHAELNNLKKTVEVELHKATEKAEKDLIEMKKAVDAVNMEQKESKNLKEMLASEIARASNQTEKELLQLKEKVGSININDLESKNKGEWENIRNDLETLKHDLKEKQLLKLEDTDKELAKVKDAISQINLEQENKNNEKFEELRKEMFALREEVVPKPKKRKSLGLMKLFTSRLRRSSVSKAKSSAKVDGKADVVPVDDAVPDDVPKILPPSLHTVPSGEPNTMRDTTANTYSEASSDDEASAPPAIKAKRNNDHRTIVSCQSKEMEVTLALHRTYSNAAEQEKINSASVEALPSFSPTSRSVYNQKKMLPSAMRRVRSMDPSAKTVTIDPYEIVRSWSKATIQANGEVELEPVIEE